MYIWSRIKYAEWEDTNIIEEVNLKQCEEWKMVDVKFREEENPLVTPYPEKNS